LKVAINCFPLMEELAGPEQPPKKIPFNNLYLLSGLVHGMNKTWMYVFTILFVMFGYLSFQLLILYPLMARLRERGFSDMEIINNPALVFDSVALGMDRNVLLLMELGMFVFAFMGFYIGIRRLHHKTLTSVLTGYSRFRSNRFWFAFLVWGGLIIAATVVSYFADPGEFRISFQPGGFFLSLIILFILMPIQTGIEELLFRGYFMQGLSLIFRNGIVPLILTSTLFGLAHMNNPEVREYGWMLMLPYYCGTALFMGLLTLLDEGLELAFGLHFANNFVSALLVTSPHSVLKAYSIFEARSENPAAEILLWLVLAVISFVIFWMRYRWKNFNLIIK
ncbi:MAG TPA: CPBP family intramembrane glutamic endopeptidase, partial [Chitinophagaceae bacterium]|nr:CPBP family intramembrane glutamic endopeptidase [Chitinophagaceae bacterium]